MNFENFCRMFGAKQEIDGKIYYMTALGDAFCEEALKKTYEEKNTKDMLKKLNKKIKKELE